MISALGAELLNPAATVRAIGEKMKNPLDIVDEEKMIGLAAAEARKLLDYLLDTRRIKVQVIDGGAVVSFERKT